MSAETPRPPETTPGAAAATPAAQHARRAPGVKPPPLKLDMKQVPEPRWLKWSVYGMDIAGGVLSAIVTGWMARPLASLIGLPTDTMLSYWVIVAAIAVIGWLVGRRPWAIAFALASVAWWVVSLFR